MCGGSGTQNAQKLKVTQGCGKVRVNIEEKIKNIKNEC
jgi:hypothetical protein